MLNQRVELICAELAAEIRFELCKLGLRQNALFVCLCKTRDGLHGIYNAACSLRRFHGVFRIRPEDLAQTLDLILCPCDAVFQFGFGIAHDIQDQCTHGAGRHRTGFLRCGCDRAECRRQLLCGHVCHRCNVRDERKALGDFLNLGRIFVLDCISRVQHLRQRRNIALQFERCIGRQQEFICSIGIHISDKLRFCRKFRHVLRHFFITGFGE